METIERSELENITLIKRENILAIYDLYRNENVDLDGIHNPKIIKLIANFHKLSFKNWQVFFNSEAMFEIFDDPQLIVLYEAVNLIKCAQNNSFVFFFACQSALNTIDKEKLNKKTLDKLTINHLLTNIIFDFITESEIEKLKETIFDEINTYPLSLNGVASLLFVFNTLNNEDLLNLGVELTTKLLSGPEYSMLTKVEIIEYLIYLNNENKTYSLPYKKKYALVYKYTYDTHEPRVLNPELYIPYLIQFNKSELMHYLQIKTSTISDRTLKYYIRLIFPCLYYALSHIEEFNNPNKFEIIFKVVSTLINSNENFDIEENQISDGLYLIIRDLVITIYKDINSISNNNY